MIRRVTCEDEDEVVMPPVEENKRLSVARN